ncbi:unnamed protein product [Closterium sp. NIES-54]
MAQASSRSFFHLASTPVAQRIVLCLLLLSSAAGAVASRHRGFVFPVSENGAASVLPATAAAATAEAATAETAAAAAAAPTPAATAEKLLPSRWVSAESARTVAGSVEDGSPVEATAAAVAMEEVRRALSHVPARGFAVFRQLLDERYGSYQVLRFVLSPKSFPLLHISPASFFPLFPVPLPASSPYSSSPCQLLPPIPRPSHHLPPPGLPLSPLSSPNRERAICAFSKEPTNRTAGLRTDSQVTTESEGWSQHCAHLLSSVPRSRPLFPRPPPSSPSSTHNCFPNIVCESPQGLLPRLPSPRFFFPRPLADEIASALVAPLLAGQPITLLVPTDGCFHPSTRARHPPSAQAEFDVTAREGRSLSETAHEERPMGHEDDVDEEDKASDVAAGGDAAGKGDVARTREVAGFLSAHVMAGAHCHEAMRAAKGSWKMPMLHGGNHVTRITPPNDQSPLVLIHKQGRIHEDEEPDTHVNVHVHVHGHMHAHMKGKHKQHLWNQDGIGFTHSSSHSSSSSSSSNEASTQVATNSVAAAPDAVTDSAAPDVAAGDTAAANAAATMTFSSDVSPGRQAGSRFEWSVVTVPDIFVSKRVVLHGVQHQ